MISENVRKLRKHLGLSQTEFAKKIYISRGVIANIELNRAEVNDLTIRSICDYYGVNEHWLRTGEGEMFSPKTTEDEIIDAFGKLIQNANNPLAQKIILTLAQMTPDEWDMAAAFIEKFLANSERVDKEKAVIEVDMTKKEEET